MGRTPGVEQHPEAKVEAEEGKGSSSGAPDRLVQTERNQQTRHQRNGHEIGKSKGHRASWRV